MVRAGEDEADGQLQILFFGKRCLGGIEEKPQGMQQEKQDRCTKDAAWCLQQQAQQDAQAVGKGNPLEYAEYADIGPELYDAETERPSSTW